MSLLTGFLENPWAPQVIETALEQAQIGRGTAAIEKAFSDPEIDKALSRFRTKAEAFYNLGVTQRNTAQRRTDRQSAARTGMTGGSSAQSAQRRTLGEYIAGRQDAALQAEREERGLKAEVNQQKQIALNQVYNNPIMPVSNNVREETFDFIDRAEGQLPGVAIGGLANVAAGAIGIDAMARGQGGRGLPFIPNQVSGNGGVFGSITGNS